MDAFLKSPLRSAQSTGQSGSRHTWVCSTGAVSEGDVLKSADICLCVCSSAFILFNLPSDLDLDQRVSSACCWGNVTWNRSRWRTLPWFQPKRLKICFTCCFHRTWSSYRYMLDMWKPFFPFCCYPELGTKLLSSQMNSFKSSLLTFGTNDW